MASENYAEMIKEAKRFVFMTVFEGFCFNGSGNWNYMDSMTLEFKADSCKNCNIRSFSCSVVAEMESKTFEASNVTVNAVGITSQLQDLDKVNCSLFIVIWPFLR